MEFNELAKAKKRMCDSQRDCVGCPIYPIIKGTDILCKGYIFREPREVKAIITRWVQENPLKTRQSEFLKIFPDAALSDGVILILPCIIEKNIAKDDCKKCVYGSNGENYAECRKKYWLEELV